MKIIMKQVTPKVVRRFLGRLGQFMQAGLDSAYAPSRWRFPSVEGSLYTLKQLGFESRCCIDVGAYHGEWSEMFHSVFPYAQILMVEAQEAKRTRLQEIVRKIGPNSRFEIALLGSVDGKDVPFCEMETGSSVLEEASPYPRRYVKKALVSLDSLLARDVTSGFKGADFLKLDTQGYELEILRGARIVLRGVRVVLMETSLIPINRGCPLFAEVIEFMTENMFRLFDFCSQIRRRDGILWQTDLMFIREDCGIVPGSYLTKENWG